MKRKFTQFMFTMVMFLATAVAYAQRVSVDKIQYECNPDGTACIVGLDEILYGDVVLPNSINIDGKSYAVTAIGDYAMAHCSDITVITFPAGLTEIGSNAFQNCASLSSLTFPAGLTEIGRSAFKGCSGLKTITFSEGLKAIGNDAFRNCFSLVSTSVGNEKAKLASYPSVKGQAVIFPNSLTSIGDYAFCGCDAVKVIVLHAGLESLGNFALATSPELVSIVNMSAEPQVLTSDIVDMAIYTNATLHVLPNCKVKYQNAIYWNSFYNIKEDAYIVTGIENTFADSVDKYGVHKVMENGRVVIRDATRNYNTAGVQVR